jgi:hypothetical protein
LVVAARKISASTPHCYSQRLVPFSKSGVPGQKLSKGHGLLFNGLV